MWLAKGGTWRDERIAVWALGSTDSGVSWIVETEGRRIFHAGDLNNWYAKFLPDAVPGQKMYSFEMEEVFDPIAHEKQYLGELKDIRKVVIERDTSELVQMSEREQARPKVKWKAKKSKWRVLEATLLGLAIIGGSIGAWLGIRKHGQRRVVDSRDGGQTNLPCR